ncbi:hypothetical protein COT99_01785 [Candidatus Falkowbacteria bacterium CG10_big_fil_rev_8_21_14_0_10_43_10]|uniref:Uncharacterized protein n=1 Tax=Candidatus Falkowbacteria bacterium CG10_big_fil_rev_8_21_14_0_10_43_10 TaxID=1974567 RepID=A0A2H0V4H9_9BACT|nr:MAG: hypothetical protein COT99_01785 [Candidatus Falkowbacteria bacterium CG10_big_fil_rev_8_21_14_0_10_43_10]
MNFFSIDFRTSATKPWIVWSLAVLLTATPWLLIFSCVDFFADFSLSAVGLACLIVLALTVVFLLFISLIIRQERRVAPFWSETIALALATIIALLVISLKKLFARNKKLPQI